VPFLACPISWPRVVLSDRPEAIAKKEGKESVKSVDGLANVARNGADAAVARVGSSTRSNPAIRAQQQTPMPVVQVQLILTICLPKFLPCNSRRNASGTRSIPSSASSLK
jgi:hypothetical protein